MSKYIKKKPFGVTPDGESVDQYELVNSQGISMEVITFGGIITVLKVPDRVGNYEDIVLGFDHLAPYLTNGPYLGAIIGRYGNRIAKGKFEIEGEQYILTRNNGENHLHGGEKGFDKKIWKASEINNKKGVGLKLSYLSKHMEEGYPGNLDVSVEYLLTDTNDLEISYQATTDRKTIINLTHHSYFNLAAKPEYNILNHKLYLNAKSFLPLDENLIPSGELHDVKGTSFDFREETTIKDNLEIKNHQLDIARGFDHCWVLNKQEQELSLAASLYHQESGRNMEVLTTEPGIQFYSGNFLDGSAVGKKGIEYNKHAGLCLETEHFPDTPNKHGWPSVVLSPDEKYTSKTIYRFSVKA